MRLSIIFGAISVLAVLQGCNSNRQELSEQSKADSTFAMVADITIAQLKIAEKHLRDPKITAAIKEYETARTDAQKSSVILTIPTRTDPNVPACPEVKQRFLEFATLLDTSDHERFDLAIRQNDVVVEQVKLMNTYFNELDKETVNAIAFYEQLSLSDKKRMFSENVPKPVPDYERMWMRRELEGGYLRRKLEILQRLNNYLVTRKYINEFPQGFRTSRSLSFIDEKTFDLLIAQK